MRPIVHRPTSTFGAPCPTSTENQLSSTRDSQPHQHDMTERNGHLYPEADTALRDRLDALYGTAQPAPASTVVHLRRPAGRGPSVAPGGPGDDESAADDAPTTL